MAFSGFWFGFGPCVCYHDGQVAFGAGGGIWLWWAIAQAQDPQSGMSGRVAW